MFNFRIRDCKVVRFMPRRAAAPSAPYLALRIFERFYDRLPFGRLGRLRTAVAQHA